MLVRLTGLLESIDGGAAVIATADGLAREVLVPAYLADLLSGKAGGSDLMGLVGRSVRLHLVEYLEGVNQGTSFTPRLLGFGSPRERDFFELLTSVKGLGNRRALRALAAEPGMIARAITERDTRVLQKLPEIGPKLAETIVHELKSKAEPFIGLRPSVEVGDELGPAAGFGLGAGRADASFASFGRIEMKSIAATSNGAAESAKPTAKSKSRTKAAGENAGTSSPAAASASPAAPPVPPIHETVRLLISLGEQPMEAERMVARAVDRAAGEGRLVEIGSAAALLAAAYSAR